MFDSLDLGAGAAVAFFLLCMTLMAFSRSTFSAAPAEEAPRKADAFRKPLDG